MAAIRRYPASHLLEKPDFVLYCPYCFQVDKAVIYSPTIRLTYQVQPDGTMSIVPESVQEIVNWLNMVGGVFLREQTLNYASQLNLFLCPECDSPMHLRHAMISHCMSHDGCVIYDRNNGEQEETKEIFFPPGCYVCQVEPVDRYEVFKWCGHCYLTLNGEVDCEHCEYEYGRRIHHISLEQIREFINKGVW